MTIRNGSNSTPATAGGLTRRSLVAAAIGLAAFGVTSPSSAQEWPSGPIEVIVGFAPGGGTDIVGRALADALTEELGVPVQVVNRAGGGGVVGFEALRTAEPDGLTIGILTAQIITANLRGVMEATHEDFETIAMVNIDYGGFAVHNASPLQSLDELLDQARENPARVTMGNGGEGGSFHMLARNLEAQTDVEFVHVPFDGGPAALLQLLGQHIDANVNELSALVPYVESGEIRVLAAAGTERYVGLPDVPTTAELGYPLDIATWRGVGAPKGTPPEIIEALEQAVARAVENERLQETFAGLNANIVYMNAQELRDYLHAQEDVYRQIMD